MADFLPFYLSIRNGEIDEKKPKNIRGHYKLQI